MPEPIDQFVGKWRFLSNFYETPVEYSGIFFPTSEHAFQAAKTKDRKERVRISQIPYAGDAKIYGQTVALRKNWNNLRIGYMAEILEIKFSSKIMQDKLLQTGDRLLIEGNNWNDRFWGACVGISKHNVWIGRAGISWYGQNHLGKLLMKQREILG